MKKAIILLCLAALLLFSGCANTGTEPIVDRSGFLKDVYCDAVERCPEGFECASFPETGLNCYPIENSPCDFVSCPAGKQCVIAESYPVQIFCS